MSELIITASMELDTALHIGDNGTHEGNVDLLRRDSTGQRFISGSAIVGALRALATRLAPRLFGPICQALQHSNEVCACAVCRLFGALNPDEGGEQGGYASLLCCDDAYPFGYLSMRDKVGIERATGVAAHQGAVKFDSEVQIPAHTPFALRLTLRLVADAEIQRQNELLLSLILHEWQAGRASLGGKVGRGLSALRLTQIEWYRRDLHDATHLMNFLRHADHDEQAGATRLLNHQATLLAQARSLPIQPIPSGDQAKDWASYAVVRAWVQLDLTLAFEGPLLINDLVMARHFGLDHAPLEQTPSARSTWMLPGAGLHDVLRKQAEQIARTLATRLSANRDESHQHYPSGEPPSSHDPNQARAHSNYLPKERAQNQAANAGQTRFIDGEHTTPSELDLSNRLFGSVHLGSRLHVEDGELISPLVLNAFDVPAMDRFIGAERDSAQSDAVALWNAEFRTRLQIENPETWELGWLLLTLRDLHAGLSSIGFGRAEIFGRTQISDWSLRIGYLDDADRAALALASEPSSPDQPQSDGIWCMITLAAAAASTNIQARGVAQAWIDAFIDQIRTVTHNTSQDVLLQQPDTSFGQLETLYPPAKG